MYPNTSPTTWSPSARSQAQPSMPTLVAAFTEADLQHFALPAFTRFTARSTAEVVALLSRERPSAVVLDLEMNGLDAAMVCRTAAPYESTSVLVAMADPKHAPSVIKAGCHAILLKPFAYGLVAAIGLGECGRSRESEKQHERHTA